MLAEGEEGEEEDAYRDGRERSSVVGCEMEEKEKFLSELDEVVDGVPRKERLVIGADFNGHVGEGNREDEEVMGRYGFKERNVKGQIVVDFAKRMEMAVVNTYFKKKEDHRVTYKSGGRCTQVDYVLYRRCNLKEIGDCKVLAGDSVARQHRMVVCRMVLEAKKKKSSRVRTERRIRWWKLKEEECSVRFREDVRERLGGVEEVLDDWANTAGVMREAAKKVLETVALSKRQEMELKVAELKMLRFLLGVTRMDRIRNEFIRGTAHVGCFGDTVRKARLRWFGHVQRRDMNYIGRRMLRMDLQGRRKRGRPRWRFMDVVREDMQVVGVKEADVEDRVVWRRMIRCGDPKWKQPKEEEDLQYIVNKI
ncbi:hypothetical protein C0J50_18273 [Silurus asotus]|uniref:Craniofacial development protein 2-like n=1 Tax=Silurus asotus TaxID=30991 RepID=A0AAD5FMU8_SILAS|nr:hypothetical protein C0J50_18273 [Silurus asotus]